MDMMVIARPESQLSTWDELCRFVDTEQFEPVEVLDGGESIQFDYSSRREQTWLVGIAVSLLVAVGLAAVLSVPFAFLITLGFVYLNRSTDDYLLLDGKNRVVSRVKKFLGKVSVEELVRFGDIRSVVVRPVEQQTGQSKWTEYWLELEDGDGRSHSLLSHPDSRNKKRALRIGSAVAGLIDVPLVSSDVNSSN